MYYWEIQGNTTDSKVNFAAISVALSNPVTEKSEWDHLGFQPIAVLVLLGITVLTLTFSGIRKRKQAYSDSVPFTSGESEVTSDCTTSVDYQLEPESAEGNESTGAIPADTTVNEDAIDGDPIDNTVENLTQQDALHAAEDHHLELVAQLGNLPAAAIAEILQNEQVSTIAVVLSELNEHDAGPIWACLPTDMRELVIESIRAGVNPDDLVFNTIASTIITQLGSNEVVSFDLADRISNAGQATFAHRMPRENMDSGIDLLRTVQNLKHSTLDNKDAEDLADLSADLTSFDDLVECPEDVLRRTLEHCDTATIATALFGTTVQLQQRVLQVLGEKRSLAVESALLNPSPVRLGDIDMCRQRVLRPDAA